MQSGKLTGASDETLEKYLKVLQFYLDDTDFDPAIALRPDKTIGSNYPEKISTT